MTINFQGKETNVSHLICEYVVVGPQLGGGKHMIPSILEQILMLWHNIRHSAKEIKHFDEIWPSYLTFEIL